MKSYILLILLLLAPIIHLGMAPTPSVIDYVESQTVRLIQGEGEDSTVCSGFFVDQERVLTAKHCVDGPSLIRVNGLLSTVIASTDSLALLDVGMESNPLSIRNVPLSRGESVTSIGYAWGDTKVIVLNRRVAGFKLPDFAFDGPIAPGMSGGPIVDDRGRVVGINQGTNTVIGVGCGAGEILDFLSSIEEEN